MTGHDNGNELTGLAKLGYKPVGLALGLLGGLIAGKVFGLVSPPPCRERCSGWSRPRSTGTE